MKLKYTSEMKRPMKLMLISLAILFGVVILLKLLIFVLERVASKKFQNPIVTISATKATTQSWHPSLNVVGSTRTVKGVNVTTELPGMIEKIDFTPGSDVKKGTVLAVLDLAPDIAKLHSLQAQAVLDTITYHRDKKQYAFGAVSKEQVDTDYGNMKSAIANVAQQKAIIQEKIIKAPFTGRLGISEVNPGQYIDSGTTVVNEQTLNPIYVDFFIPQQQIQDVSVGQQVTITSDRAPGIQFDAPITTINPMADKDIRNVEVEATLPNPKEILLPGMFTDVTMKVGQPKTMITLPVVAVTFNPYGAIVYLLTKTNEKHDGQDVWKAEQQFVDTGDSRGNQIAILKGIKVGDMVVTSGQLKLRNGSLVTINNDTQPSDSPNPVVPER